MSRVFFACLMVGLLAGCTFERTVVNAHQGALKTAWIRPGVTTFDEVIEKLGVPPMIQGVNGYSSDALHYVSTDSFMSRFEAGWIVTPTFEKSTGTNSDDILITFDKEGVVTLVSRTHTHLSASGEKTVKVVEYREAK